MFTGIIEEIGAVMSVQKGAKSARLAIRGALIFGDLKVGDSVAVNGVCLTATGVGDRTFTADVMAETLRRSNLGGLAAGSRVNLERAMAADGRFGGHIVSGHIDGTGRIVHTARDDNAVWVTVSAPPDIMRLIVEKGSVAIDGISLTVARVDGDSFAVSLIPHTGAATTLLDKAAGGTVNLENDIIGKYIERLAGFGGQKERAKNTITMEFLANAGF
ncbi:riboflavin synthase alpha chain [Sporobacter termitidis DSM 10068]|uniref:Riboflavin synthase n=1 Tax=Sporobacter termitidis DSM 10068 TaxID=1123282 RepID=A0A1M5XRX1_9FIRM|nr:riboflavin synthase [Sporobacter termitidis]SHI02561.1 riboflavin synthase alpha chain [Sporobacter termitidis DSM 10068]